MSNARELAKAASSYGSGGFVGMKNRIINGDMRIDQRNSGSAVTIVVDNTYVADRFAGNRGGSVNNYTVQQSSVAPVGFSKSLLATMGTGVSVGSSEYAMLGHKVEGFNVADFGLGTANASPFTLSFWVRCSVTGTFGVGFRNNTANATYCSTYTINAANTWEYKTISVPAITSGAWTTDNTTGIYVTWDLGVGTTYSGVANQLNTGSNYFGVLGTTKLAATTGATFQITGVQLEKGTQATGFEFRHYGTELALCQRYYFASTAASIYMSGQSYSPSGVDGLRQSYGFPVSMRANPTASVSGGTDGGSLASLSVLTSTATTAILNLQSTSGSDTSVWWQGGTLIANAEL
jgi:hypothetical protein